MLRLWRPETNDHLDKGRRAALCIPSHLHRGRQLEDPRRCCVRSWDVPLQGNQSGRKCPRQWDRRGGTKGGPEVGGLPRSGADDQRGRQCALQWRAVAGIPSPEIQWTRQGGGRLTSNAEVLSGGVLRITRVTGSEAGSYVCTATNTAGRATIVTSLTIQEPPTVRLQPSGSLQIVLGRPLRLECLVEGEPR